MNKQIVLVAAILGMLAVIAGASGAHGLKPILGPEHLDTWRTAVQYHFYHVFALLFVALIDKEGSKLTRMAANLFIAGIICFSGSLYLLAFRDVLQWSWLSGVGPVTPIGGLFFIVGWLLLAVSAYRSK